VVHDGTKAEKEIRRMEFKEFFSMMKIEYLMAQISLIYLRT
jgi:hypothetical protein